MNSSRSSLGNILTTFILQPLNVIIAIIVARTLGPEDKGIFTYVTIVTGLFVPIALLGFNAGSRYFISIRSYKFKDTFWSAQLVGFLHGCLAALILWLLWKLQWLGETGNNVGEEIIYFIMLFSPFTGLSLTLNTTLTGASKFKTVNIYQILISLINVLTLTLFVIVMDLGLKGAMFSLFTIKVLCNLFFTFYISYKFSARFRFQFDYVKNSYTYGIKSWFGNIANQANAKLDHLFLSYFTDASTLGIYSVAYNYTSLLTQPLNGIMPVLFNRVAVEKDKEGRARITELIHRSMLWIAIPFSLALGFASEWLIPLLYGEEFAVSSVVIFTLLPGIIAFMVTRRCLTKYLAARGFPGKTSLVQITGALVGLLFYVLLIPSFGITGAAMGTTLAFIASAVQSFYYFRKDTAPRRSNLFYLKVADVRWMKGKITEAIPTRFKKR